MGENELVPFVIRGPTPTHCSLEGGLSIRRIGSSIIDLHFPVPSQLGELTFTNFYSAFISIYVKRYSSGGGGGVKGTGGGHGVIQRHASIDDSTSEKPTSASSSTSCPGSSVKEVNNGLEDVCGRFRKIPSASGTGRGKTLLLDLDERPWDYSTSKRLMICPHFELGSQDPHVSIQATESLVDWRDVFVMRLVIHQPSSVWKQFTLEDIKVFRHLPRRAFHFEDVTRQKDNRLAALTQNTLRMLSGMTVEPEPEKLDK